MREKNSMRENRVLLSREKANCMKQVQAALGRRLKEEYDSVQPLPDRLSDLLRKLEEAASKDAPFQRG